MAVEKDGFIEIQCPFYKWRDRSKIACEGIGGARELVRTFRSGTACRQKLMTECCSGYEQCAIYRLLMAEKYSEAKP